MNRKEEVDRLVGAYQDVISQPTVVSGRIAESGIGSSIIVSSVWTQRSLERGQLVKTQRTDLVTENNASNITTVEINEQMSSWSPSGRLRCVVRQINDAEKTKQFMEVWESDRIWKNFDVAAFDQHGEIYTDDEFGSLQWDPSEKKILYVAEKKKPQARPFYKQGPNKDENQSALGEEYAYVEDWGEQLEGKSQPVIAVCDLAEDVLKLVPGLPDRYSPGQLVWNKTGDGLFGLGLENTPRRLGLVYCTRTPGAIFHLSLEGAFSILTANGVAPRSPRLSPDGNTLVWLQRTAGGPPDACMQLISMDLPFKKTRVVLDIVKESSAEFPGIYSRFLPPRCFSNDGLCVVVNTVSKYDDVVFSVSLDNARPPLLLTAGIALDVHNDVVLVTSSSLTRSPNLALVGLGNRGIRLQVKPSNPLKKAATVINIDMKSNYASKAAVVDCQTLVLMTEDPGSFLTSRRIN